jgi:hypothetical protein
MTGNYHSELLAYVRERLHDDQAESDNDDRLDKWLATASPADIARWQINSNYEPAKQRARNGDFEPSLKILAAFDPDLADLITGKRQKRRRRQPQILKAIEYWEKRDRANTISRIRELIKEKINKAPSHDLVKDIAAEVLNCDPEIIAKIIHRGTPR